MVDNANKIFEQLGEEEKRLEFDSFSREDAFDLGILVCKKSKNNLLPLGIEIVLNGLMVFCFYPTGITRDHVLWLERKRKSVEFREMSSFRLQAFFEMNQATLTDWLVDHTQYVLGGGGYPIKIKNTGMIGSVCVSGYPDQEDHKIIVESIAEYLHITL